MSSRREQSVTVCGSFPVVMGGAGFLLRGSLRYSAKEGHSAVLARGQGSGLTFLCPAVPVCCDLRPERPELDATWPGLR